MKTKNNLTDSEVNKIIADFMGSEGRIGVDYDLLNGKQITVPIKYIESLDTLVPVWNKLRNEFKTEMIATFNLFDYNGKPWCASFETNHDIVNDICIEHESDNPFQAAAHATAKAILELKDKDE